MSHKLLRWGTPLLLGIALGSCALLSLAPGAWAYRVALLVQLGFYSLALLGRSAHRLTGILRRPASLAHYFVAMNAALTVGLWRFLVGKQGATWNRTERGPGARAA